MNNDEEEDGHIVLTILGSIIGGSIFMFITYITLRDLFLVNDDIIGYINSIYFFSFLILAVIIIHYDFVFAKYRVIRALYALIFFFPVVSIVIAVGFNLIEYFFNIRDIFSPENRGWLIFSHLATILSIIAYFYFADDDGSISLTSHKNQQTNSNIKNIDELNEKTKNLQEILDRERKITELEGTVQTCFTLFFTESRCNADFQRLSVKINGLI